MEKFNTIIPYFDCCNKPILDTLYISNPQWNTRNVPTTYANLFCTQDGLHVVFKVQEQNPLALKHEHMSRVCEDSAVELFLGFANELTHKIFKSRMDENLYMNIEINSNGAAYIKYGKHRKDRSAFSNEQIELFKIQTKRTPELWECSFIVPSKLIEEILSYNPFVKDSAITFNLYKICETKGREQFASYNKVDSDTPNFHIPESFACGLIK